MEIHHSFDGHIHQHFSLIPVQGHYFPVTQNSETEHPAAFAELASLPPLMQVEEKDLVLCSLDQEAAGKGIPVHWKASKGLSDEVLFAPVTET
jgi:hypothetical protein